MLRRELDQARGVAGLSPQLLGFITTKWLVSKRQWAKSLFGAVVISEENCGLLFVPRRVGHHSFLPLELVEGCAFRVTASPKVGFSLVVLSQATGKMH